MLPVAPPYMPGNYSRSSSNSTFNDYFYDEDRGGLDITEHEITMERGSDGQLGMSMSGGLPMCPLIYVSQISKHGSASTAGIELGDELQSINGVPIAYRMRRKELKEFLEACTEPKVTFAIRRIVVDYDIVMKKSQSIEMKYQKFKHKLIEKHLDSSTADVMGFTRAIIANDYAQQYVAWVNSKKEFLASFKEQLVALASQYRLQADVYETLNTSCGSFVQSIDSKKMRDSTSESSGNQDSPMMKATNSVGGSKISDLGPVLFDAQDKHCQVEKGINYCRNKIVEFEKTKLDPCLQLLTTYEKDKYEFLSFFLKARELEEEELESITHNLPNWRLESGNYDYRMLLKAKLILKEKFKKSRQSFMDNVKQLESDFKKIFYEIVCLEYASVINRYHESVSTTEEADNDARHNNRNSSLLQAVTESESEELIATRFNHDIDGFFEFQSEEPSLIEF